jgi:threonine/homoserine/homoserine lactone efflux protein
MLEFGAADFLLITTPGPGAPSAAGVGAGFGYRPGVAYVAGLWCGNNLVASLVIFGVAAAVQGRDIGGQKPKSGAREWLVWIALAAAVFIVMSRLYSDQVSSVSRRTVSGLL